MSATVALFNQAFIDQLLIALQDGEWIEPIIGRNYADGREGIALLQHTLEDEGHHSIA